MLYHKEIGFPKIVEGFYGKKLNLEYTRHAKLACLSERYGTITHPPFVIEINKENLIEIEIENNLITKVVVRIPYDNENELALAIIPEGEKGTVKSLWANLIRDKHFTLDKSKYNSI